MGRALPANRFPETQQCTRMLPQHQLGTPRQLVDDRLAHGRLAGV